MLKFGLDLFDLLLDIHKSLKRNEEFNRADKQRDSGGVTEISHTLDRGNVGKLGDHREHIHREISLHLQGKAFLRRDVLLLTDSADPVHRLLGYAEFLDDLHRQLQP